MVKKLSFYQCALAFKYLLLCQELKKAKFAFYSLQLLEREILLEHK